ncbi:MAG: signal recognition particle protein [Firmicutes bacterium]|nr:signal recognition particle protein [Bacillota bacterium]
MFEALTEKLEGIFKGLRRKGHLTAGDVQLALREVRLALLGADVNFRVVKAILDAVAEKAVGREVLESLSPAQEVLRVVRDELIAVMGGSMERVTLASQPPTVIYLVGLQGSGKTTSAAKLARMLVSQGHRPLLVAADVYRPAAVDQLQALAASLNLPVYTVPGADPVRIAGGAVAEAKRLARDVVVVDTAGRLHVDEALMAELEAMAGVLPPHETLLVVDAMTGQDAVRVAEAFQARIPLTGIVLTKMDGDARGGAALSLRYVTRVPIKLVGSGEKLDALEPFYPDRMAWRILGMGDVQTLIDQAEATFDREESERLAARIQEADFTLEEFRSMLLQVRKLGPLSRILEMLPGGAGLGKLKGQVDDRSLVRVQAIIDSMTRAERRRPEILNASRRRRIAMGSGTSVQEVNRLLKQFEDMKKMMKQMKQMEKKGRRWPLPFGGGGFPEP